MCLVLMVLYWHFQQREDSSEAWAKEGVQHRERSCGSKWTYLLIIHESKV